MRWLVDNRPKSVPSGRVENKRDLIEGELYTFFHDGAPTLVFRFIKCLFFRSSWIKVERIGWFGNYIENQSLSDLGVIPYKHGWNPSNQLVRGRFGTRLGRQAIKNAST